MKVSQYAEQAKRTKTYVVVQTVYGAFTVHKHWVTPGPKEVIAMKEYRKEKGHGTD